MENEVIHNQSTNSSTVFDILTILARNTALLFTDIDRETFGLSVSALLVIIITIAYVLQKAEAKRNKNVNNNDVFLKGKKFQTNFYQTRSDNYDYHKILNEFHNVSNNCCNIFSSMKCVQLASNYPELINVRLLSDGVTPFHRVCFRGNEPLIELMLAKGADPELRTVAGENALVMALYYYLYTEAKDFRCLDLLRKKGCHLNCTDEWYETFLNLAVKSNNKSLALWLLTNSKPPGDKLFVRAPSSPI